MLTIISPAKKLLDIKKPYLSVTTEPALSKKTSELISTMKLKSADDLAKLMDLSKDLAQLNYERYQRFDIQNNAPDQSYPAVFLFQGDVYQGLAVKDWGAADVDYAQNHLRILSGLYGLLKPLDRIQPYRLEMGVRLANSAGDSLYSFWQDALTQELNKELSSQSNPMLINLASTEYSKAINLKKLSYPTCTINFYEHKNNEVKMIGIYAKKARGLMAKYIMQNKIDTLDGIKAFCESGYRFSEKSSSEHNLDFVRTH